MNKTYTTIATNEKSTLRLVIRFSSESICRLYATQFFEKNNVWSNLVITFHYHYSVQK